MALRFHDPSRARPFTTATSARDVLDVGVDLLVTDDPAIVSYAAHNDALLTLPLPWDRAYVVLASESARLDVIATLHLTLAGLLTDAVRADWRIAEPLSGGSRATTARRPWGRAPSRPDAHRRAWSISAATAWLRELPSVSWRSLGVARRAAKTACLSDAAPEVVASATRATAAALSPSAFAAALHAGDDLAYVLPLPRFTVAPCHEFATLLRSAPWVQSVIPLIDTRSTAIVRRERVGLAVDADGSLRLLDGASVKNGKP